MDQADSYAGLGGRFYSAYIAHPLLGRPIEALLWGGDAGPMYRSLEALADVEAGATIIDAGCGAGLALRWLEPARVGRYIGTDSSPAMLDRARRHAHRVGFDAAELELADIADTPLQDAGADLYLLYNSLHVVPDPDAAVAEAARCLKPGGRLMGSALLRGEVRRVDRIFEHEQRKPTGLLGRGGTHTDLRRWLDAFTDLEVELGGSLAVFHARRP